MMPVQLPTWKIVGHWLNKKVIKHPRATGTNFLLGSKFIRSLHVSNSPLYRQLLDSLLGLNLIFWMLPVILILASLKLPTIQWLTAEVYAIAHIGLTMTKMQAVVTTTMQVVTRSPVVTALGR